MSIIFTKDGGVVMKTKYIYQLFLYVKFDSQDITERNLGNLVTLDIINHLFPELKANFVYSACIYNNHKILQINISFLLTKSNKKCFILNNSLSCYSGRKFFKRFFI